MALIKCPECGKEISEYAVQCGYCFYPLRERTALASADGLNSVSLPKSRIRNGKPTRNANGAGSITHMRGNRRRPYRATVTVGWEYDEEKGRAKQIRKDIGYFATKTEAQFALANYAMNPYDIDAGKMTFAEVYERWSEEHYQTISESNIKGYKAAYCLCEPIADKRMADIKLDDLQWCVDNSGKNTPTLRKFKVLIGQLYKFAIIHDIVSVEANKTQFIDIKKAGNPNRIDREPFTRKEVEKLWKCVDTGVYCNVVLMMIYSGCRISELLNLRKEDVSIKEHWFDVTAAKTEAGVRRVPIADKVLPFFQYWYDLNDCEYLISTPDGKPFKYQNFKDGYWKPLMNELGMNHRPHDTRHTCISMLTEAAVDERLIQKIVGHKGHGVTQQVYTHIEIQTLFDAINKI